MVRTSYSTDGGTSFTPGQGIKILYAAWCGQNKKKKKEEEEWIEMNMHCHTICLQKLAIQ